MDKDLSLKWRMYNANKSGKMSYKRYKLCRWADGFWHVYDLQGSCIAEELSLPTCIELVDCDIAGHPK